MRSMRYRIPTLIFGISTICLVIAYLTFNSYSQSLFNTPLTRVNIAIWGEHSYVISLGKTARQHYIFLFPNSYEVQVPGGLRGYKIGSLGKLAQLEQDPQLFAKAMGQGSKVFIHKSLHNSSGTIYDNNTWLDSMKFAQIRNDILRSIFGSGDLTLFDRLYLYLTIREARPSQTTLVRVKDTVPELLLYDKVFRSEKKLVQVLYTHSEKTALFIAQLLENSGIRVADITQNPSPQSTCTIIEPGTTYSQTSQFLSSYFDCELARGDTGLYEIQWILDERVEKEWKL
ncbi:hypothetical protein KBB12_00285 [Candidatus Woesebacteria bacterium]|nr:hypothetical protein [Candidatus Woesebacteria bacterium]